MLPHSEVLHHIKSSLSTHSGFTILLPLLSFSLFSHSHLLTCSCLATISVALYWCPKYLTGVIGIPVSSTVLAAHREIFQGCHILIVKLRVMCILLLSPFFSFAFWENEGLSLLTHTKGRKPIELEQLKT